MKPTVRLNQQIRLARRPRGLVQPDDFRRTQAPVPDLNDGQVLVRHLYLALDPAIRNWMDDYRDSYVPPLELDAVVGAITLGQIVDSRNPGFSAGDITWHFGGWEEYSVIDVEGVGQVRGLTKMKVDETVPLSNYLSVCGTTGLTAYFGLLNVGQPKLGDTVLVSGAAGAVGSIVGQIARFDRSCRVIGIAGGPEKCRWLTEDLRFDTAIDYKDTDDLRAAIAEACPDGVDVFFDNVGGDTLDAALMNLSMGARVVMCGMIANYGEGVDVPGPRNLWQLLVKNARLEGFTVAQYAADWARATRVLERWYKSGLLQHREEVVPGLENTVDAFRRLFTGENRGRLIVKLADPE